MWHRQAEQSLPSAVGLLACRFLMSLGPWAGKLEAVSGWERQCCFCALGPHRCSTGGCTIGLLGAEDSTIVSGPQFKMASRRSATLQCAGCLPGAGDTAALDVPGAAQVPEAELPLLPAAGPHAGGEHTGSSLVALAPDEVVEV